MGLKMYQLLYREILLILSLYKYFNFKQNLYYRSQAISLVNLEHAPFVLLETKTKIKLWEDN